MAQARARLPQMQIRGKMGGELQEGKKATFVFLLSHPGNAKRGIHALISDLLSLMGGDEYVADTFTSVIAIIDAQTTAPNFNVTPPRYPIPVEILRRPLATVKQKINEKNTHAALNREEGHDSVRAPLVLTEKTLALVFGGMEYLLNNARLYLEETGAMRRKAFDLIIRLALLVPTTKHELEIADGLQVNVAHEQFDPCNFDALVAAATARLTTEEVIDRLGES
jgi:hypothetical protein